MRLIDADALYEKTFCTAAATMNNPYGGDSAVLLDDIDNAPTIEAEHVKHGRWISVEDEEHPCDEWDCTACGQRRTFLCEMDADDMKEDYPYCPNCGAKMDLEG